MLKLKLNSRFYNKTAIDKTIKDYSSLGNIKSIKKGNYFIISFDKIDLDVKKIITDEFSNYALAQMIKNK